VASPLARYSLTITTTKEAIMPELNKWQVREAEQYAKDNDVEYDAAVKALFPGDTEVAPPADEPDDADGKAPAGTKTSVKK
jgi:hypothetical protein